MQYEDLLVAFCCLFVVIERSKEIYAVQQGVVGPLLPCLEEECVAKEPYAFSLLGQQWCFLMLGGRASSTTSIQKPWEFDTTRGFPGEDI